MAKRYRDYAPALALLAGCAVLTLALLLEWAHYRGKDKALRNRLGTKVEVRLQAPPPEQPHDELPPLDGYNATIERPLFMEDRRPAVAESTEQGAPPAPRQPLTAKLMGVVVGPGQTVGLFVDAQGKYKRLRQNDSIGGWKVAELHPDTAIMEQDETRKELKVYKEKPKTHGPVPPPGTPPMAGPFPAPPPNGPFPTPAPVPPPFGVPPPQPINPDEQPAVEPEPPPMPSDPVDETIAPPEIPESVPNE